MTTSTPKAPKKKGTLVYRPNDHVRVPFLYYTPTSFDAARTEPEVNGTRRFVDFDGNSYSHRIRAAQHNLWMACTFTGEDGDYIVDASCGLEHIREFCGGFMLSGVSVDARKIPSSATASKAKQLWGSDTSGVLPVWRSAYDADSMRSRMSAYDAYPADFRPGGAAGTMLYVRDGLTDGTSEFPSINKLLGGVESVSKLVGMEYMADALLDSVVALTAKSNKRSILACDKSQSLAGITYLMNRAKLRMNDRRTNRVMHKAVISQVGGFVLRAETLASEGVEYDGPRRDAEIVVVVHDCSVNASPEFYNWNSGNKCVVYTLMLGEVSRHISLQHGIVSADERNAYHAVSDAMYYLATSPDKRRALLRQVPIYAAPGKSLRMLAP